jgi:hypothetical protein
MGLGEAIKPIAGDSDTLGVKPLVATIHVTSWVTAIASDFALMSYISEEDSDARNYSMVSFITVLVSFVVFGAWVVGLGCYSEEFTLSNFPTARIMLGLGTLISTVFAFRLSSVKASSLADYSSGSFEYNYSVWVSLGLLGKLGLFVLTGCLIENESKYEILKRDKITHTWMKKITYVLPPFVNPGLYSNNENQYANLFPVIGAVVHLLALLMGLVADAILRNRLITPNDDVPFNYWLFSFLPFILVVSCAVLCVVAHVVESYTGKPNMLPLGKWLCSVAISCLAISAVFSYLLTTIDTSVMENADIQDFSYDWRVWTTISLASKLTMYKYIEWYREVLVDEKKEKVPTTEL